MEQILFIRETLISFYKKYEIYISFALRFLIGFMVFSIINQIDFVREEFLKYTVAPLALPLTLLGALLFAVLPPNIIYLLIIFDLMIRISAFIEIAVIVLAALLCVMFFYVRLAPRKSILILATVLAFYFKIPYLVPIFAGLYMGLTSIVPVIIGVFIWELKDSVLYLLKTTATAGLDFTEMPATFTALYSSLLLQVSENTEWVFISFIFAVIVVAVYAISRLSADYSREIAIALGAGLNIVAFVIVIAITGVEINIFSMILFTLVSAVLAEIIHFFDIVLDYSRAEKVQFEDEDNYYYVKVIPKVNLSKPKRVVKRIRANNE